MDDLLSYLPALTDGVRVTILLTSAVVLLFIPVASFLGLTQVIGGKLVRISSRIGTELLRGTSTIVQLFWVYYALPMIVPQWKISPMIAAVAVLSLNMGGYVGEIFREAVQAVPREQREAAFSLHLPPVQEFRRIILPQAMPSILAGIGSFAVISLHLTAIVGFISIRELLFWTDIGRRSTGNAGAFYGLALVIYFALTVLIRLFFRWLVSNTRLERVRNLA